jgi:hypothetical protein
MVRDRRLSTAFLRNLASDNANYIVTHVILKKPSTQRDYKNRAKIIQYNKVEI